MPTVIIGTAYILWKTIHGLSNIAPPPALTQPFHNTQQQINNHTQIYCELFHQTIHKHCQTRNTQDKHIHYQRNINNTRCNITLTTTQVQAAIKQIKNNNSQGPDKLNTDTKHARPCCVYPLPWPLFVGMSDQNNNIQYLYNTL